MRDKNTFTNADLLTELMHIHTFTISHLYGRRLNMVLIMHCEVSLKHTHTHIKREVFNVL